MQVDLALTALEAVAEPHRYGHRCTDGKWHNPAVGTRTPCAVTGHLDTVRTQLERLALAVHDAASNPVHLAAVAEGLLAGTPLVELDSDTAGGWLKMAEQGIEALAVSLDTYTPALTGASRA